MAAGTHEKPTLLGVFPSSIKELLPGVHRLSLGRVNVYLVRLQDGSHVLIDAGLPQHANKIREHLAAVGLTPSQLRALLLTHRHLDHAGGAAALRRLGLRETIVHRDDAAAIEGREPLSPVRGDWRRRWLEPLMTFSDRYVFRYQPVPVRAVEEPYAIDELELIQLPGHTPGHAGYWLPRLKIAFAGDAAMTRAGKLRPPSELFTLDPHAARRSQLRLAALEADLYCFGHGAPLRRGADALRALAAS